MNCRLCCHSLTVASSYTRLAPSLNCNAASCFGWFPIHVAVLTEDPQLVAFILAQPGVEVNVHMEADFEISPPPLDVVKSEFCKNPVIENTKGATPLHYACMIANEEIINLLVEKGASYTAVDEQRRRPIEYFQLQPSTEPVLKMYNDMFQLWLKKTYMLDLASA